MGAPQPGEAINQTVRSQNLNQQQDPGMPERSAEVHIGKELQEATRPCDPDGPLAGLVAVCAGSDIMHPIGALITGLVAGSLFVWTFTLTQNRWKIDDVLGVWPLHGLCGVWGGVAAGIFGSEALGGLGGVSLVSQLLGSLLGVVIAVLGGLVVYGDTVRSSYGILPPVTPSYRIFFLILAIIIHFQLLYDLSCYFGQSILFYQGKYSQFNRCNCRW